MDGKKIPRNTFGNIYQKVCSFKYMQTSKVAINQLKTTIISILLPFQTVWPKAKTCTRITDKDVSPIVPEHAKTFSTFFVSYSGCSTQISRWAKNSFCNTKIDMIFLLLQKVYQTNKIKEQFLGCAGELKSFLSHMCPNGPYFVHVCYR